MTRHAHIAVVDDEIEIREMLRDYLELHGYRVSCADGGAALRQIINEETIDLALLDISMPGEDGLSLARFLSEHTHAGIIMLTARGDVVDRIVGIEIGADDYLVKPVDLRELLARVTAILRRYQEIPAATAGGTGSASQADIPFGDCRLNPDSAQLHDPDGKPIKITTKEFDLLKVFAANPNRVLSRDQLSNLAYERDWDPFDRSIDIRIARLRRKIERNPSRPQVIKTVHGLGYRYSTDAASCPAA